MNSLEVHAELAQSTGMDLKAGSYTIDLTRIAGKGEFRCPGCGIEMSPDDETECVYSILETVVVMDELQEMTLRRNGYGSHIHLVGFHVLNNTDEIEGRSTLTN